MELIKNWAGVHYCSTSSSRKKGRCLKALHLPRICPRCVWDWTGVLSLVTRETNIHLTTTSFQVPVESNKVPPQPPLLWTKPPQFPQPLLIRLALQPLSPASLPFSGQAPAPQCPSRSEGTKAEHSTRGAASPVPSTGAQSLPCKFLLLSQQQASSTLNQGLTVSVQHYWLQRGGNLVIDDNCVCEFFFKKAVTVGLFSNHDCATLA